MGLSAKKIMLCGWVAAGYTESAMRDEPILNAPNAHEGKPLPVFLKLQPDGVLLAVKLQPRASRNEIVGPVEDELKIKVTAPPVDAAANEALVRLLAEKLGCGRGRVELVRGHTSRHKIVKLYGVSAEAARQCLV